MARVYFGERQTVKSVSGNKDGHVATYYITINRQRLPVRATHHDMLDMLPGIMSSGGRIFPEVRHG